MSNERNTLKQWIAEKKILAADKTAVNAVDVVYGGAYSVKDYYMESGNPQQMRGASQLLQDAAKKFEDCRYFECGAESFLIVPQGEGKTRARELEQTFREFTITAQAAAVWRETTVDDLLDEEAFGKLWKALNEAFRARRMLLFWPEEQHNGEPRCKRCNFRDVALGELCASCANKVEHGGKDARESLKNECLKHGREIGIPLTNIEVKTTQDIADGNGDIALLYGDINNLGWAGKCLGGNVETRRLFCEEVKCVVTKALRTAVVKAISRSKYRAFEIIAVGGDDICLLLPGEIALLAGTLLLEEFDRLWAKRPAELKEVALTIRVGIAVGQANTPILYMREAAEQLMELAKGKACAESSCLDILTLNSDGQWATSVKKLRADLIKTEGATTAICTMRPFTKEDARMFLRCLCSYDVSKNTLYNIAEASARCGIAEGDLWFRYLLSRQKKDAALIPLAGEYGDGMYFEQNGTLLSPWLDFTQLQGQKGGERP